MAHMMEQTDKMVSGRKQTVWHQNETNTILQEGLLTPDEAWTNAFSWEPVIEPVTASDGNGGRIIVPGEHHIIRDDMPMDNPLRFLATGVSGRYSVVSNLFCCQLADSLVKGGHAKIDTAGSLYGGRRVYVSAALECFENVMDDKIGLWVLISTTHDGKSSAIAAITTIRVVCHNTLTVSLNSAQHIVKSRHNGKANAAENRLASEATRILGEASKYLSSHSKVMETLAGHKITLDKANQFLTDTVIPGETTQAKNQRERVLNLYKGEQIGGDQDAVNNSLYGLLNAWSQWAETESTIRIQEPKDGGHKRGQGEARTDSVLFGALAKKRSDFVNAAVALV